MWLFAVVK
jgi:hypothetical protein